MADDPATIIERATSGYSFERTPGREAMISAFENLLGVMADRVAEHERHGSRELREITINLMQRSSLDLEMFCRKWEESDAKGVTY